MMAAFAEVNGKPILLLRKLSSPKITFAPLPQDVIDLQLDGERGAWLLAGAKGIAERLSFLNFAPPHRLKTYHRKRPRSALTLRRAADRHHLILKESDGEEENHLLIPPTSVPYPLRPPEKGETHFDTIHGSLFAFINTATGVEVWERPMGGEWQLRAGRDDRWYVSSLGTPSGIVFHTRSMEGHALHRTETNHIKDLYIGAPTDVLELRDADEDTVRVLSQSLTKPKKVLQIDLRSGRKTELFTLPAIAPPPLYREERSEIANREGVKIPVTLLYKKGTSLPAPLLLIAYGAYGHDLLPTYDPAKLLLADAGFVIGLVHARGGGEKGPEWHSSARGMSKGATVIDIIDTARALIGRGLAQRSNVYLRGRSAGAVSVAVAAAEEPGLIKGIVLDNPYLDLYGALQDRSNPLVLRELLEWGDPHDIGHFQKAFSPLARSYSPHLKALITVSTSDEITPLSEALRLLQILRKHRGTDVVLNVSTTGTHFGESAATRALEEECLKIEVLKHWSNG